MVIRVHFGTVVTINRHWPRWVRLTAPGYYKANHVVAGHTIIAEVVTMHYGGRVFDTDVPHAREKSEYC